MKKSKSPTWLQVYQALLLTDRDKCKGLKPQIWANPSNSFTASWSWAPASTWGVGWDFCASQWTATATFLYAQPMQMCWGNSLYCLPNSFHPSAATRQTWLSSAAAVLQENEPSLTRPVTSLQPSPSWASPYQTHTPVEGSGTCLQKNPPSVSLRLPQPHSPITDILPRTWKSWPQPVPTQGRVPTSWPRLDS